MVKNLNADRVDGKSAEDFVEKGSLMFAAIARQRGTSATTAASPPTRRTSPSTTSGGNQAFTVPFAGDVSKCVATATLAAAGTGDSRSCPC